MKCYDHVIKYNGIINLALLMQIKVLYIELSVWHKVHITDRLRVTKQINHSFQSKTKIQSY
jgi:hypothetical protein